MENSPQVNKNMALPPQSHISNNDVVRNSLNQVSPRSGRNSVVRKSHNIPQLDEEADPELA